MGKNRGASKRGKGQKASAASTTMFVAATVAAAVAVAALASFSGEEPAAAEQIQQQNNARKRNKVTSSQWTAGSSGDTDLFFYVRSESVHHDRQLASALKQQLTQAGVRPSNVILQHVCVEEWEAAKDGPPFHVDYWVLTPLLIQLHAKLNERPSAKYPEWVVFLEPNTQVNVPKLRAALEGYDSSAPMLLGHMLKDSQPSIVHFFETNPYPLMKAGAALSAGALRAAVAAIENEPLPVDSHTDPIYQWAAYLKTTAAIKAKFENRSDVFCGTGDETGSGDCATTVVPKDPHRKSYGLKPSDVIIGVKTCKVLENRLKIVLETYAKDCPVDIVYLSDHDDPSVPTVDLTKEFGEVVNQKKGHCAKTDAIMKYFIKHHPDKKYYVINDDDSWMDVRRLLKVLDSYDPADRIWLGERYGYAHNGQGAGTYDYITMGGGMAMSKSAVLARNNDPELTCLEPDTYDDMQVGRWMSRLDIKAVHEEGFHQARPEGYHTTLLKNQDPVISFHKFADGGEGEAAEQAVREYREWFCGSGSGS